MHTEINPGNTIVYDIKNTHKNAPVKPLLFIGDQTKTYLTVYQWYTVVVLK